MPDSNTCFVIAPIGSEESEERRRSDQILKHITAVRADNIPDPGIITSQIITHLLEDPVVVADLSGRNPNVFYELAVRHAIRKPVVQIIQAGETIPFDIAATRTLSVDHRDLANAATCKDHLIRQMKATIEDPGLVDTPISVAVDMEALRTSDQP